MNFSAPTARPSVARRLRTWLLGATVGVVAVGLGTAALPGDVPVTATDAVVASGTVATTSAPAARPARPDPPAPAARRARPARTAVAPSPTGTPTTDRVPSRLVTREVVAPPARLASTLDRSAPTRVRIPAIGVDSDLVGLGLRDDGLMEVPRGAFPAGWYTGAPTPGELGPAVLAGHVDYGGVAGVFYRLRELEPGDAVEVARDDGSTAIFRVTRVEQHRKDAFPTAAVYGDIDHAGLRLITCGGSFDRGARSYEDNIVVFAQLDRVRGG